MLVSVLCLVSTLVLDIQNNIEEWSKRKTHTIHGGRNNNEDHHDGDDDQHAGSCGTEAEQEAVVDIRCQNTLDRNHTADRGDVVAAAAVVVESLLDNPAEGSLRGDDDDDDEAVVLVVVGMEIQTLTKFNFWSNN